MKEAQLVPMELREQTHQYLYKAWEKLKTVYKVDYELPSYDFYLKGKTAGVAFIEKWHLSFNSVLLIENKENFLKEIPAHELAHLFSWRLYKERGHGKRWKEVMYALDHKPNRCHAFDINNSRVRKLKRFAYKCDCSSYELSSVRHNRFQKGTTYFCKKCKTRLRPQISS